VQEAFLIVMFVTVILSAVIAVIAFAGAGRIYGQIGRGHLSMDREHSRKPAADRTPALSQVSTQERDDEIRQMLDARNRRRARRGQETVDVEEELARLLRPAVDDALRGEIRDLVVARNARRVRQGKEPLDVEAEVERQLREAGAV
jgi:hypothetical protein